MLKSLGQVRLTSFFITLVALLQLLILVLLGLNEYLNTRARLFLQLEQNAAAVIKRLDVSLPGLLWNFEGLAIQNTIRSEMHSEVVNSIQVFEGATPVYQFYREGAMIRQGDPVTPAKSYKSIEHELQYRGVDGNEVVGRLRLDINAGYIEDILKEYLLNQFILILFVTLFLVAVLLFVFRFALLKPLRSLLMARHTFRNMSEAFVYVDLSYRISETNLAALAITEYADEALLGMPYQVIFPLGQEGNDTVEKAMREFHSWAGPVHGRTAAGEVFPAYLNMSVIKDRSEQPLCFVLVFYDRSEQRDRELRLQQAVYDAQAANRTKAQFLAAMSHEIRTPMNGVVGAAQLLEETVLSSEQKEYLEIINASGEALLSLINDILDYSKLDAGKVQLEAELFDLEQLGQKCLKGIVAQALGKQLELVYDYGLDCPRLFRGDEARMRQVVSNLLSNAVKFTERGRIELSISCPKKRREGQQVIIRVCDDGIGIAPELIPELFEEFNQGDMNTTRKYGGTGLGLAITSRLVKAMQGEINVTSKLGEGSCFSVNLTLPVQAVAHQSLKGVLQSELTLMYVDDSRDNRRIYGRLFEYFGVKVDLLESPHQVLPYLQKRQDNGDPCQLAVIDYHFPQRNGLDLVQEIRSSEHLLQPRIMLFTSIGVKNDFSAADGIDACLNKLSAHNLIADALQQLLDFSVQHEFIDQEALQQDERYKNEETFELNACILVVEDTRPNQLIVQRQLLGMGAQVLIADNGSQAIEQFQQQTPDLVLMDCRMPKMDGLEATRRIRAWETEQQRQPVPIIALTANATAQDRRDCLQAGMDELISKPFRSHELKACLRSHLPGKIKTQQKTVSMNKIASEVQQDKVLDHAVCQELLREMGEDAGLLVESVLDSLNENLDSLAAQDEQTPQEDLIRYAHSMKSPSGSIGAMQFYQLSLQLETQLKEGNAIDWKEALGQLRKAQAELKQELQQYR